MTGPLARHLARRIAVEGPITVAAFMADALGHPQHGYYVTRDPLGAAGDFTTAPEISQMFGELIGLWAADCWTRIGAPDPVLLVELGPGRGTLMADALRAARMVPAFRAALRVHLVETSPVLRARQAATLAGADPVWHDDLTTVPPGPAIMIANEFFDALPIRQFRRGPGGWHERRVTVGEDGGFAMALDPLPAAAAALIPDPIRLAAPVGAIAEVSPTARAVARSVGERIATDGGAALIVDYGHDRPGAGDTLQAVRDHRPARPLEAPGAADLTAHVCFASLAEAAAAAGAAVHGPIGQGAFLAALGIRQRADALARAAPEKAEAIRSQRDRLIGAEAMGTLFRVLALGPPHAGPLAGF